MKSYKKTRINVKGSVLFTVVSVMSILTILVFSAVTLAAAANRRAHNSYANNQTQYTARSVIDLVWDEVTTNANLRDKVFSLSVGEKKTITVKGIDSSMGMGEIVDDKVSVQCYATDSYKMSLTVKMMGQENTIAAYFEPPEAKAREDFPYSFISFERIKFDGANAYGGVCLGIEPNGNIDFTELSNNCVLDTPIHVNANFKLSTLNRLSIIQDSGVFVGGTLIFGNDEDIIPVIKGTNIKYRSLPYLFGYEAYYGSYGGGDIQCNESIINMGNESAPMLVIARNIQQSKTASQKVYGDLYLYDRYDTSVIGSKGGAQQWTNENVIAKKLVGSYDSASGTSAPYTGGNIYSQGKLELYSAGGNELFANNIVANEVSLYHQGGLGADIKMKTTGAIVAKKFNIENTSNNSVLIFKNGVFVDPNYFTSLNPNPKINEVKLGTREVSYMDYVKKADTSMTFSAAPGDGEFKLDTDLNKYWDLSKKNLVNPIDNSIKVDTPVQYHPFNIDYKKFPGYSDGMYVLPTKAEIKWSATSIGWDVDEYRQAPNGQYYRAWQKMSYGGGIESLNFSLGITNKNVVYDQKTKDTYDYTPYFRSSNGCYTNVENKTSYIGIGLTEKTQKEKDDDLKTNPFGNYAKFNYSPTNFLNNNTQNHYLFELSGGKSIWIGNMQYDLTQAVVDSVKINAELYSYEVQKILVPTEELPEPFEETLDTWEGRVSFLKSVNDKAFADNGNVIQIDDIDKAVQLRKNGSTYSIYKVNLIGVEEGTEGKMKFPDTPEFSINVTKYKDYEDFLLKVIEIVTYPETLGTHQITKNLLDVDGINENNPNKQKTIAYTSGPHKGEPIKLLAYRFWPITFNNPEGVYKNYDHLADADGNYYWYGKSDGELVVDGHSSFTLGDKWAADRVVYDSSLSKPLTIGYDVGVSQSSIIPPLTDQYNQPVSDDIIADNKIPIPLYQYDNDGNPKLVEIFNGLKTSGKSYGFVNDTPLMGNYEESSMRQHVNANVDDYLNSAKGVGDKTVYDLSGASGGTTYHKDINAKKTDDDTFTVAEGSAKIISKETVWGKPDVYTVQIGEDTDPNKTTRKYAEVNGSWCEVKTFTGAAVIEESCVLMGTLNTELKIIPKGDMFIKLQPDPKDASNPNTFTFNKNVTVDDSNGAVHFVIPVNVNVTINADILTTYYSQQRAAGSGATIKVPQNPLYKSAKDGRNMVDDEKIPDIYFYQDYPRKQKKDEHGNPLVDASGNPVMGEEEDVDYYIDSNGKNHDRPVFTIDKGHIVSAYIQASSAKLVSSTGGSETNGLDIEYYTDVYSSEEKTEIVDGKSVIVKPLIGRRRVFTAFYESRKSNPLVDSGGLSPSKNAVIGACIFGDVSLANNSFFIGYINPNPTDINGKPVSNSLPKLQYYQAY